MSGLAINMLVQKLCREEEVGVVGKFCWEGLYVHEGWASSKQKGAAVYADKLSAAVDSGMESITHIFGSKYFLN